MKCVACGGSVDYNDIFCPNCGKRIESHHLDDSYNISNKNRKSLWIMLALEILVIIVLASKICEEISEISAGKASDIYQFIDVMESYGLSVKDITSKNHRYFSKYVTASYYEDTSAENNSEEIVFYYGTIKDKCEHAVINEKENYILEDIFSTGNNIYKTQRTISISTFNYNYYSITKGNNYYVAVRKDNLFFFAKSPIIYQGQVNSIVTSLNFGFSLSTDIVNYLFLLVSLIIVIFQISLYKMFEKAGISGWKSLIPIYNIYCIVKITFNNGWLFLLSFLPIINIFFSIILLYKLARLFKKGILFSICNVLFTFITLQIISFDDSLYSRNNV